LGDGKYGKAGIRDSEKHQALYSYKLTFAFSSDAAELNYLSAKTFTAPISKIPFATRYFPSVALSAPCEYGG
jgi:23S rRNA pseudouridine955/2504/2580 synthase